MLEVLTGGNAISATQESLPARAEFTWTAASPVNEFAELHKARVHQVSMNEVFLECVS